ncbi:MAG: phytanoyl-CoA dioxygenase family protein [Propionibacteriaceae bacterium]|nr:phytanoyl-CoA dioxygenase family protein [Propionibacteriaceae bacterium]
MTATLTDRTTSAGLTIFESAGPELVEYFRTNGFALLGNALSPDEVAEINAEALRLCRGDLGEISGATFDGDAASAADDSDEAVLRRYLCIHYPHKMSEVALRALKAPRIVDALVGVIGPNVKAMQSMLFIKSEGKPGQAWHQDEFFIPTRDRSLTAVWIALDDATIENGCLWVLPGSHQRGVIYPAREQDDPRFDCTTEAYDFPYSDADSVPVEIPAGTAVIFNGYLLHRSLENSGKHGYRRALANHYMSAESLLPWRAPQNGEHMAVTDFRDILMVAGADPYAYKGTEEISRPYSRPDKDGGCDR